MNGYTEWFIPDCYFPAGGTEEPYVSHESVCVLNAGSVDAALSFTLFFEDMEPMEGFRAVCGARRTHHVRLDKLVTDNGRAIPRGVPYAIRMSSSVPVYVQYSRCDTTQANMAFMTAIPPHS
ncbi:MAG: sensory rhodopsin transducer [Clostridia bacterium]|nr:sensory rhodopsin transducer [Clostridia bacterium]